MKSKGKGRHTVGFANGTLQHILTLVRLDLKCFKRRKRRLPLLLSFLSLSTSLYLLTRLKKEKEKRKKRGGSFAMYTYPSTYLTLWKRYVGPLGAGGRGGRDGVQWNTNDGSSQNSRRSHAINHFASRTIFNQEFSKRHN